MSHPARLALASGPGGRLTAVWSSFGDNAQGGAGEGVYSAELSAPGAAWSEPVRLADRVAYTVAATAAEDGAVTAVWEDRDAPSGEPRLRVASRAAGAAEWGAAEPVAGATSSLTSNVALRTAANGATLLTWSEGPYKYRFAYRPAGSAKWGAAESIPSDGLPYDVVAPQLGPDGEVTAVWIADISTLFTATRSADGAWSQTRTLVEHGPNKLWGSSVGPDGSFTAVWTDGGRLTALTRKAGVWQQPVVVGQMDDLAVERKGLSTTGTDGRAVVVWNKTTGRTEKNDAVHQVWAAATGAPKPSAPAKRRDYVGDDGFPDLYARGANGSLLVYQGNAGGTVSAKADGGTWPTTSTIVPFGDLDGDGANDTLVTNAAGEMYRYSPQRGTAVTPQAPSAKIGTGWSGMDALTYSGDFNRDGIPDLVARQIATGDLYMYAGTEAGTLTRTGRVGTSWKSLTIVGAGDLNNDGNADVLARTTTGDLYRYYGTGNATIGSGAKIGSGWGGMADFTGIGDLTGDGKDDILGRHTNGDLYRYAGNGTGGIGSGVKIGSGWGSFTSVS